MRSIIVINNLLAVSLIFATAPWLTAQSDQQGAEGRRGGYGRMGGQDMGRRVQGTVTAARADKLTLAVMRPDNISQVIAVDEGTSFQRGMRGVAADVAAAGGMQMGGGFGGRGMGGGRPGGEAGTPPAPESITLADIKVGNAVM